MLGKLRRTAQTLRSAALAEVAGGAALPLPQKLALWRRGFKSTSYVLFDLAHHPPEAYVSDLEVARARRINGAFGRMLKDKLLFEAMLRPYARVPKVLALIERGRLVWLPEVGERGDKGTLEALFALSPAGVIAKPVRGNKGRGVLSLQQQEGALLLSGHAVTAARAEEVFAQLDGYLVVERVEQAPYAAQIFPGAANTVRVLSMRDPDTGEVFFPAAMHRFGGVRTQPTDNFQTGGVSAAIDLATGRLGRAVRHPNVTGGRLVWLSHHPDTGALIEGVVLPHWEALLATLARVLEVYPFLRYVGWDVLVTPEGVCLIEGNHNVNLGLQVHGPLLRDPRVRRFYEAHGVLRRR
ncbi:sugar-transfer associated ATP-grasp domain-containing protein [Truepera radiovictrix]|uniref:Alpha-L-glutamate ligase-related protein ATP-grasp domain-containing protein n=1 Tax=Truepera radiovictrix (strain DSM 17093 / CIP 108686 / LMG 22925 / RQ-24) TaxID=649638 RepID=D7CXC2_TRURR|nr:sugar-transfer associated ATP-grasp domain-containing protein [Truepera radiovictrix]ADI13246.1 hypothetical protein Trad_0104 [Truepera radiovictrix DSM 17093]WMT58190.1 sugar-transfer associated ATP-grasp domain-containing protein [Truepera radiovictrix]